jgi:hypothetical protein
MSFDAEKLDRCKQLIEEKLGWGEGASWQQHDFRQLRDLIVQQTGVDLSESTLRRIWGKVKYDHLPSMTTLNTLAVFAGYANWRSVPPGGRKNSRVVGRSRQWKKMILVSAILAAIALIVAFSLRTSRSVAGGKYRFSSRPVTRSIPNSVIFEYDASLSPTDSVFIQQSWDKRRRAVVSKSNHTYTSVYYEPGFYSAKLIVGDAVVKEHPLVIPTKGWLGLIDRAPIPVYLDSSEFVTDTALAVPLSVIEQHNVSLQPDPPVVKLFSVGNFEPVPLTEISFEAEIINRYREGAAACQATEIALITDGMPITIPMADSGCVSQLNLISPAGPVSGRDTDLSGFGVDFHDWVKVACKVTGDSLEYLVNGKRAYITEIDPVNIHVVGVACYFKGAGSVRKIKLRRASDIVFTFPALLSR